LACTANGAHRIGKSADAHSRHAGYHSRPPVLVNVSNLAEIVGGRDLPLKLRNALSDSLDQ